MGYTHYWTQKRPFTPAEWQTIVAEAKRIVAKAKRGEYYSGKETYKTAQEAVIDLRGFHTGFGEPAWRTFPHKEIATPQQGAAIAVCGPDGTGQPEFTDDEIALKGDRAKPEDAESFALERARVPHDARQKAEGIFNFCKTEYRPCDAVVVSILDVARRLAPDAIAGAQRQRGGSDQTAVLSH